MRKYSLQLSWCFPASLPRASPRLAGSFLGQSPIPWPAWLNQGQGLRSDPVLPAPTSILFAGPLGPEVGAWVGGPERGSSFPSFSSCLQGPPHPLAGGQRQWLSPQLCPLPRNGGGAGPGQTDKGGGSDCSFFHPLPHPPRDLAGG